MFNTGDRVAVESEKTGIDARAGTVTAIVGQLVKVHWDDGHDSSFVPAAGSMRVLPALRGRKPN